MKRKLFIKNNVVKAFFILTLFFICASFNPQPEKIAATSNGPSEDYLFGSDEIFEISLKGDIRKLLNDRSASSKYHPITFSYKKNDGTEATIPVEMKTRGHFRKLKTNCTYPPLFVKFSASSSQTSSIFRGQSKLKLVMPCADDNHIVKEWLAYKIYNLVTPQSFKARLVKVRLEDTKGKKGDGPLYALLLEEDQQMAARNKATLIKQRLKPQQTQQDAFIRMAVFQYLIGNTDWSVEYLQNIKLIEDGSSPVPIAVPYDFDHSGIVNAPYAHPAEELLMSSILERRYRGYCVNDLKGFESTIAFFNKLKNDIYGLFTGCSYLDERSIKAATRFLDGFYETINNQKAWQRDFAYPCDRNGTGNIVIKGLRED